MKALTLPRVISSAHTGGKERKEKCFFVLLRPGITAHNSIEGISQCSCKVQFAAAVFSFSVSGLLLLLQATSCQITISSRLHQLIFTAHPLLPVKR